MCRSFANDKKPGGIRNALKSVAEPPDWTRFISMAAIQNPIYLAAPFPWSLWHVWPWVVLRQTNRLHTVLYLQMKRGWGSVLVQPNLYLDTPPHVYPLLVGVDTIPRAIFCLSMRHWWNEGFTYKTMNMFLIPSERSCPIPNGVFELLRPEQPNPSPPPPLPVSSRWAALSGTVRIEVKMSACNEMLSGSRGRNPSLSSLRVVANHEAITRPCTQLGGATCVENRGNSTSEQFQSC